MTTKLPLDRITTGLAAPFIASQIDVDLTLRQPLESHAGLDQAVTPRPFRRNECHSRIDAMRATREEAETLPGLVLRFAFGQDAATDTHHRIGREQEARPEIAALSGHGLRGFGFFGRQSRRKAARQFGPRRCLVNVGGNEGLGLDTDLLQQSQASRRGRSQHQLRRRGPRCGSGPEKPDHAPAT